MEIKCKILVSLSGTLLDTQRFPGHCQCLDGCLAASWSLDALLGYWLVGWLVGCGLSTISVTTKVQELSPCSKETANRHTYGKLRRLPIRPPGNRTRVAGSEVQMHVSAPTAPVLGYWAS